MDKTFARRDIFCEAKNKVSLELIQLASEIQGLWSATDDAVLDGRAYDNEFKRKEMLLGFALDSIRSIRHYGEERGVLNKQK